MELKRAFPIDLLAPSVHLGVPFEYVESESCAAARAVVSHELLGAFLVTEPGLSLVAEMSI